MTNTQRDLLEQGDLIEAVAALLNLTADSWDKQLAKNAALVDNAAVFLQNYEQIKQYVIEDTDEVLSLAGLPETRVLDLLREALVVTSPLYRLRMNQAVQAQSTAQPKAPTATEESTE